MKSSPTSEFEERLLQEGVKYIAGVDEAGRGPVAGPVTAAAVILPVGVLIDGLRDSKQLSETRRDIVARLIREKAVDFAVSHVAHDTIDSINILNATRLAVKNCVEALKIRPQVILIDGRFLNLRDRTCISVVKGDAQVSSIAAASILAKTTRDSLMREYAKKYPDYSFERNKGYLTTEHLQAIRLYGYSPIHRRSFTIPLQDEPVE